MQSALTETHNNALNTFPSSASPSSSTNHGPNSELSTDHRLRDSVRDDIGGVASSRDGLPSRGDEKSSRNDDEEVSGGVALPNASAPIEDFGGSASASGSEGSSSSARKKRNGERIARYEAKGNRKSNEIVHVPFVVKKVPWATEKSIVHERYPNEVLMHIMQHLDIAALENMSFVSKRFNQLVNSPIVWKSLFFRDFQQERQRLIGDTIGIPRRYFTPLTQNPTWKSEYIQRTALLRAVSKGKLHDLQRMKSSSLKPSMSTVVTYDARAGPRGTVTHISAKFPEKLANGEYRGFPRLVAASTDTGMVSYSDYAVGTVEKATLGRWADPDDGPPSRNHPLKTSVFDVSEEVGWIHGKPREGGVVFIYSQQSTQTPQWSCGLYASPVFTYQGTDGEVRSHNPGTITSVWIVKSRKVGGIFKTAKSLFGALSGSSRGMLTAYELRPPTGNTINSGGLGVATWKICPGISIVGIKVNDAYSHKDWKSNKPWCFIINMLGEVYYSTKLPTDKSFETEWYLIPHTKREENPAMDKTIIKRFSSPREEYLLFETPYKTYSRIWKNWTPEWWIEVDWPECNVLREKNGEHRMCAFDRYSAAPVPLDSGELSWDDSYFGFGNANSWLGINVTAHAIDNSNVFTGIGDREAEGDGPTVGNGARLFAIGTDEGRVFVWDIRSPNPHTLPLRDINTMTYGIYSLALTSLILVTGSIEGTCLAWDVLGTSQTPLRVLNAYSPSMVERHISALHTAQALDPDFEDTSFCVRAITLDPDPTSLRGVFGLQKNIRSFSIAAPAHNRRKKARAPRPPTGAVGGATPKRAGKKWNKVIASETQDVLQRREKEERENEWLESRFGTSYRFRGRDDLTEEEQLEFARALSLSVEEEKQRNGYQGSSADSNFSESVSSSTTGSAGVEWTAPPDTILDPIEDEDLARALAASLRDIPATDPSQIGSDGFLREEFVPGIVADNHAEAEDEELARALAASLQDVKPSASSRAGLDYFHNEGPASSSATAAAVADMGSMFKVKTMADKKKGKKKVTLPLHNVQFEQEDDARFEDELQRAIRLSLLEKSGETEEWDGVGKGKGRA